MLSCQMIQMKNNIEYKVVVGGSNFAREVWKTRTYKHKSSARRRIKQIQDSTSLVVGNITLIPQDSGPVTVRLSEAQLNALLARLSPSSNGYKHDCEC